MRSVESTIRATRRTRFLPGLGCWRSNRFADNAHNPPFFHDPQGPDLVFQHQADQFRSGGTPARRRSRPASHIGCDIKCSFAGRAWTYNKRRVVTHQ